MTEGLVSKKYFLSNYEQSQNVENCLENPLKSMFISILEYFS